MRHFYKLLHSSHACMTNFAFIYRRVCDHISYKQRAWYITLELQLLEEPWSRG